jgi:hypothetical protein
MQFPPISTFLKYWNYCPRTLVLSTAFLAKPMFRVNKPLLILEQTMDVMWQNIPWYVKEYSTINIL